MKKFLTLYLLPFLLAFVFVYFLSLQKPVNAFLFPSEAPQGQDTVLGFIPEFSGNDRLEQQFLWKSDTGEAVVFIMGSSELQDETDAVPYRFIPLHSGTRVQAYGHAGNQCFSVFCQLLAHTQRLKGSRIVFILSPGWFESRPALGTSSPVFLEYVSPRFLEKMALQNTPFSAYASERIAQIYSEFNAPSLPLKINYFKNRTTLSPVHKLLFAPLLNLDKKWLSYYKKIINTVESDNGLISPVSFYNPEPAAMPLPWDSMLTESRIGVLNKVTNNSLGISNDYYDTHIKGRRGHIRPVPPEHNTELKDFRMLMRLVRAYEVDAFFVIQPLNACYYENLNDLKPVIDEVRKEIKGSPGEQGFTCADFFVTASTAYDKALLTDVMHFSEYGWYRVNQAVMTHYNLK